MKVVKGENPRKLHKKNSHKKAMNEKMVGETQPSII
jgi:hypothetical protein